MAAIELKISEQSRRALNQLARVTGKSEDDLVNEAVEQYVAKFPNGDRLTALRAAKGIWQDRNDLPSLDTLRRESNRDPS